MIYKDDDRSISDKTCKLCLPDKIFLFKNGHRILNNYYIPATIYQMYICPRCRTNFGFKDGED